MGGEKHHFIIVFFSALHISWQKKHYPSEAQKRTQHAQNSTAAEIGPTPPTD
jgi:hypothetical protein